MRTVKVWADGVRLGVRVFGFWPNENAVGVDAPTYVDIGPDSDAIGRLTRPKTEKTNTQPHPLPSRATGGDNEVLMPRPPQATGTVK